MYDPEGEFFNTNPYAEGQTITSMNGASYSMSYGKNLSFTELLPGTGDELIASAVKDNYEVVYGHWPQNYDEVVVVINGVNEMPLDSMYELGYLPYQEYLNMQEQFKQMNEVEVRDVVMEYEEVVGKEFYIYVPSDEYEKAEMKTVYP